METCSVDSFGWENPGKGFNESLGTPIPIEAKHCSKKTNADFMTI